MKIEEKPENISKIESKLQDETFQSELTFKAFEAAHSLPPPDHVVLYLPK